MGRKSSGQDRREGAMDKAKGRIKGSRWLPNREQDTEARGALGPEEGQVRRDEGQTEEPL